MTIGQRIKKARREAGLTQAALAALGCISRSYLAGVEGDRYNPSVDTLQKLASALGVPSGALLGEESAPQATDRSVSAAMALFEQLRRDGRLPENLALLDTMRRIPLVGEIACGTPILAEENIEDWVDLPRHIHADYALTCRGESMIGAGICDGDVVYIRQQPEVQNGQIAAVRVDEDTATLKRFYREGGTVTLVAENPAIPPQVFSGADRGRLSVLGLAVAFTHRLV